MEHQSQPEQNIMDDTVFRDRSLELITQQVEEAPYPGYPEANERFWTDGSLIMPVRLPLGPWETSGGGVPTIAEQEDMMFSVEMDRYGRPLHPWFYEMVEDSNIGVVTGKGFYRKWGPNYTADPVIVRQDADEPQVLLINRKDTQQWALPGGFVDPEDDNSLIAARREAKEEALIDLDDPAITVSRVYEGPVADPRLTANAWPETSAYCFVLPDELAKQQPNGPYEAGDDAAIAQWVPVSQLKDQLFGSHRLLIERALATLV